MIEENKINLSSSTIEKGLDIIKEFLGKIIGPPAEELGFYLADNVRMYRFKNQIKILQKAEKIVKDRNINTKQIPIKILVPLLEHASLEENIDLQARWANLLVNYIDSKQNLRTNVFPYILSQLSTDEANTLDLIREKGIVHYLDLKIYDAETSNLVRLGVIRQLTPKAIIKDFYLYNSNEEDQSQIVEYDDNDIRFEITELGWKFVDNCKLKD